MKILYIYRHPDMGFSIGKVFRPIEEEMKKYAEVDSIYLPVPNYSPRGLWMNIRAARKAVSRKHYDIIHITGAEHYLIPFLTEEKVVVTVHDLGFYTNHKKSIRTLWKYLVWIRTLRLADAITFISKKSMEEAKRLVKMDDERTFVVNNPVGKEYVYYPKAIDKESPVVLHVGTKPNKNLDRAIVALKDIPCELRIIGVLTEEQKQLLNSYHIKYSNVFNIKDEEILEEYINADVISFPSLYEGFGMPIIEGQSIGRPVLTSNLPPMNEITRDSAILVNPTDANEIRKGFLTLIANYESFSKKGVVNSERFRVEVIAKHYFDIYKQTIR